MSFQDIPPIENYQFFLDVAFKKGSKKADIARQKKTREEPLTKSKRIELSRIDVVNGSLVERLKRVIESFPSLEHLPEFYLELLKCTLEYDLLKKSLGAMNWAMKKVKFFSKTYSSKIGKTTDVRLINKHRREYYGRISSVIKQINNELKYLEYSRRIIKGYPSIKTGIKTICIVGFPNVGKTTLMYKLTGSKPEINSYPFTTKGVNVAYIKKDEEKIQLLDTPGALDRFEKLNNIEKQAYLAIKYLAESLIYVFDLTESYPTEKQEKLYKNIKKEGKKMVVYLSKTDLIEDKKLIESFKKKYGAIDTAEELKNTISK